MKNLNELAFEVNNNWTSNYKAEIETSVFANGAMESVLIVFFEKYDEKDNIGWAEAARVNEKLQIVGDDIDAIEQLKYYINN